MSLKGNLQSVDLGNVLQMLSMNQKEGTLVLFDGDTRKSIYFSRDGVSMLARGRRGSDTLGRILLRYGRITPEQLEQALARQAAEGRRLGEILREMGAVTDEAVEEAVRTQIEEEIYNLFIWKEASFEFLEGPPPEEAAAAPTRVTFDVDSLVAEAQRRADEWNHIRDLVPSLDEIYRPTESFSEVQIQDEVFSLPFASKVLECLREGRRNVSEIIEASHAGKFEACKILSLLQDRGAIDPASMADLQTMATEATQRGAHDQAAKFLLRIADLGGATPAVNMNLGYALEAMDEPERASVYLKNAAEAYAEMVEPKHAFEAYSRVARMLPTDLQAVTQMVEIACNHREILDANRAEILETGRTLALCLKELGRLPPALQILHNLAQYAPQDMALRGMLVQAYQESGMAGEACAELEAMAADCESRGNFEEAIRYLKKVVAVDRNREGVHRRIEALGKARDRTKRLVIRAAAVAAVLAAAGATWWGLHLSKVRRERAEEAAAKAVDEALSPLASRFETAENAYQESTEVLRDFEGNSAEVVRDAVAMLRKGIAGMEAAASEFEKKCVDLFGEHEEYLTPTFRATRPRPFREKANEARRQRDLLFERIAVRARELAGEQRREAEKWPSRALPGMEKALVLLQAVEASTKFEDEGKPIDVEQSVAVLRGYAQRVAAVQAEADRLVGEGKLQEARDRLAEFVGTYFTVAEFARTLQFTVRVATTPRGAQVRVVRGVTPGPAGPAPVDLRYTVADGLEFEVTAEGFASRTVEIPPPAASYSAESLRRDLPGERTITLDKVPVWSATLNPGGVDADPVAVPGGKAVVLLDRGGRIHLLDAEEGSRTFHDARTLGGFEGAPVVTPDSIYAVSLDGVVVALDLPTLKERWRVDARDGPGRVSGAPILAGDLLVAAGEGGTVMAWDAKTGRPRWSASLRRGTRMPLLFVGGWIVVDGEDGILRTVSTDGTEVIEVLPEGERRSAYPPPAAEPVAVLDKVLVAGEGKGNGFALVELPPPGAASPHVGFRWSVPEPEASGQGAWLDGEDLVLLYSDGSLRRLPARQVPKPGERAAPALEGKETPVGRPVAADGLVFVAHRGGLAAFARAGNRWEPVWRWVVPGENTITTSPALVGRMVVVGSRNGTVYALLRN